MLLVSSAEVLWRGPEAAEVADTMIEAHATMPGKPWVTSPSFPARGRYDIGTDATLAALLPATSTARRDSRSGGMTSASAVYSGQS